jgi:NADPH2:quinone reductase
MLGQAHGGVLGNGPGAGGTGAVGHYALQFARLLARVRCYDGSSAEKRDRAPGRADVAIDYQARTSWRGSVADPGPRRRSRDRVDIAANGALDAELLKAGGEAVVYGSGARDFALPFFPLILRNLTLHFFIVTT